MIHKIHHCALLLLFCEFTVLSITHTTYSALFRYRADVRGQCAAAGQFFDEKFFYNDPRANSSAFPVTVKCNSDYDLVPLSINLIISVYAILIILSFSAAVMTLITGRSVLAVLPGFRSPALAEKMASSPGGKKWVYSEGTTEKENSIPLPLLIFVEGCALTCCTVLIAWLESEGSLLASLLGIVDG